MREQNHAYSIASVGRRTSRGANSLVHEASQTAGRRSLPLAYWRRAQHTSMLDANLEIDKAARVGRQEWRLEARIKSLTVVVKSPGRLGDRQFHTLQTHASTHARTHPPTHARTHTRTHASTHAHTHASTHAHTQMGKLGSCPIKGHTPGEARSPGRDFRD